MARKTQSTRAKNTQGKDKGKAQPTQEKGLGREVAGVLLFFAGILLLYFLITGHERGAGKVIVDIARSLAGGLSFVLPFLLCWGGIVTAFSGRKKERKPGRVLLVAFLVLLVMTMVHLFRFDTIMEGARLWNYETFLQRSWGYRVGGAGVLGALLCWPLERNLGLAGAIMMLVALILACLILLRKISLTRIGRKARERFDGYKEAQQQRIQERSLQQEEETPPIRDDRRAQVIPKVAPRTGEENDPFARYLGDNAAAIRRGGSSRHQERLSENDPLPGEPWVTPVEEDPAGEDVPHFLSGRRRPRIKTEKITIQEPLPLRDSLQDSGESPQSPEPPEIPEAEDLSWEEVDPFGDATQIMDGAGDEGQETQGASPAPADAPPFVADAPADKPARRRRADMPPIARPAPPDATPYTYPPIDLLQPTRPSKVRNQSEHDAAKGKKLIETLASFGITARMIGISHGPTVTRFELSPAAGIKVSRITALADDIALALAAVSVRIEAPIPGKAAVGVEVPNDHIEAVPLRDVLESQECRRHASRLAVALGRDNAGRYIIADLARMPHVLIAGQTGSGKSVCINSIICSILYRATPDEVRLIMIDPKVVELSCYNGIPHLLVPVVTDPKKASGALQWAVNEMTERYKKFAELGVRDMKGYNQRRPGDQPAMPQIVIIIDELADLMMVAPGEVEDSICRLAQLARAAGIHLVIATQRPSVNVITGVIKANIPSRIAFTVASQVDSRTILDVGGAERLLGRGDMLYAPSGMGKTRVQGSWVSDDEVHSIVEYIKVRHESQYDEDAQEHIESSGLSDADREDSLSEFDELLPDAVELVVDAESASVSMLQRRLRVGHSRAGRLIDEMEVRGIVGPDEGSKSRKVLITREQYRSLFGGS